MTSLSIHSYSSFEELSINAAQQTYHRISHGLLQNDHFVLGLATGSSPVGMYRHLIQILGTEALDLTNLHTCNLDEYYGLKSTHPRSYHTEMLNTFFKPLHQVNPTFPYTNMHLLNGEDPHPDKECARYENVISDMGGIDLQILGLGVNGHIAFNEPGTGRESRTRKIQIDAATITANSRFFNGDEDTVPTEALTMGIATILESKEIFLLVHGPEKKNIFEKLKNLEAPTEAIPASYLLVHPHVTVFSDLS